MPLCPYRGVGISAQFPRSMHESPQHESSFFTSPVLVSHGLASHGWCLNRYEGNARQQYPEGILSVELSPELWQSSSMVSLSLVTAWEKDWWWSGPIEDSPGRFRMAFTLERSNFYDMWRSPKLMAFLVNECQVVLVYCCEHLCLLCMVASSPYTIMSPSQHIRQLQGRQPGWWTWFSGRSNVQFQPE
jgi:hypothetical protein